MLPPTNPEEEALKTLYHQGKKAEYYQPSGRIITIREQNAEDEDILSKSANVNDGSSIHNFIASIVEMDSELKRKPMVQDVENWGVKDKYYTLLLSRIHSLGNIMTFAHECSNPKCDYISPAGSLWKEDLNRYTQDFSKPLIPDENKSVYAATPYPLGMQKEITFTLSSGKVLKYNILTSVEEKLLAVPDKDLKRSTGLTSRNLCIRAANNEWVKVTSFKIFSSRESIEIWNNVNINDSGFTPLADVVCPKCGLKEYISLLLNPSFFFPVEI